MLGKSCLKPFLFILLGLFMIACGGTAEAPVSFTETPIPPTSTETFTPEPTTQTPTLPADTPLPTIKFTAIDTLPPTPSPTSTELPAGYRIVPDVVGLHYLDARQVLYGAGFIFLYSDVFDLDQPFGTILEQYPTAGTAARTGETIFLYRAFQAPGMWVGEKCRQLLISTTSGKLLFGVYLHEGDVYEIKTDFRYGWTSIYDYRMVLLDEFNNQEEEHLVFIPEWTAWYVLSLGPYEVGQRELEKYPEGVPSGCLWVYLIEE